MWQELMDGLKIMGFGMGGIFVVLLIIFVSIIVLGKLDGDRKKIK